MQPSAIILACCTAALCLTPELDAQCQRAGSSAAALPNGSFACAPCLPGKTSVYLPGSGLDNVTCVNCTIGRHAAQSGVPACTACGPGQYTTSGGQTSCTPCSDGQLTAQECDELINGNFASCANQFCPECPAALAGQCGLTCGFCTTFPEPEPAAPALAYIPGCNGAPVMYHQASCANCLGLAFDALAGVCGGCLANSNIRITAANVGGLNPPAELCEPEPEPSPPPLTRIMAVSEGNEFPFTELLLIVAVACSVVIWACVVQRYIQRTKQRLPVAYGAASEEPTRSAEQNDKGRSDGDCSVAISEEQYALQQLSSISEGIEEEAGEQGKQKFSLRSTSYIQPSSPGAGVLKKEGTNLHSISVSQLAYFDSLADKATAGGSSGASSDNSSNPVGILRSVSYGGRGRVAPAADEAAVMVKQQQLEPEEERANGKAQLQMKRGHNLHSISVHELVYFDQLASELELKDEMEDRVAQTTITAKVVAEVDGGGEMVAKVTEAGP